MTTDKQIKANRENAKKGGVKTEEGKEISKMNALTFGVYSPILFDENENKRYNLLVFDLTDEYQPNGISEESLIRQIALYEVKLHRISMMEERYSSVFTSEKRLRLVEQKIKDRQTGEEEANNKFLMENNISIEDFLSNQLEFTKVLHMDDLITFEKIQLYRESLENRRSKCLNELMKIKFFKKNIDL